MAEGQDVSIVVNRELIKPIVEAKIKAAILSELEATPKLIEKLVAEALSEGVDRDGKRSNYDAKYSFLEFACKEKIQSVTKAAIAELLESKKPLIAAEIEKLILKNKKELASQLIANLIEQTNNYIAIEIKLTEKTRY